MCFTLTACVSDNSKKTKKEDNNFNLKISNDIIKIDGIYLNNEYTDNDGLNKLFYFIY